MTGPHGGHNRSEPPTAALRVRDIVVDSGSGRILDRVSFDVSTGETVVVAGEAGFGGTTLARVIAGLLRPSYGEVLVGGRNLVGAELSVRQQVGFVPSGGGLLPYLTAADNIQYGMRLRRESEFLRRQRFDDAVAALELRPSLARLPHEMSAGQRTRVAVARLAVRIPRPSVWVVDATGDGQGRGVVSLIKRFPGEDPTVVICTDDQHPSLVREADRLVAVRDGTVVREGSFTAARVRLPDLLTARLVFPAPLPVCVGTTTEAGIECGGLQLPRPAWLSTGERVSVALPPDALSLVGDGGVPGRVVDVRPEGARSRVLVAPDRALGDRWLVYCDSVGRPRVRDRCRVQVNPKEMLVFAAATGQRILDQGVST
ncbi:MAG TPA: ATP-binding cassette domain-containing protein [Micromonosporaceae bacterium]|nr:ATP-binding cassette domain-containing protein [Micromonosporaceae bacterium]